MAVYQALELELGVVALKVIHTGSTMPQSVGEAKKRLKKQLQLASRRTQGTSYP